MSKIAPEDIAGGAKLFAESEWGKWFVAELTRIKEDHLKLARDTDAHNLTVNQTHKASGNQEALDLIQINVGIAESNTFKKK